MTTRLCEFTTLPLPLDSTRVERSSWPPALTGSTQVRDRVDAPPDNELSPVKVKGVTPEVVSNKPIEMVFLLFKMLAVAMMTR